MLQMPSIKPQKSESSSGEAQASQVPFTEDSVAKSAESEVELNVPSHNEEPVKQPSDEEMGIVTPQINVSSPGPSNEVKVSQPLPKHGIKVVANRKGFYNQMRYKEGEQFTIRSKEELGEWMTCVDPSLEKEKQEFFKKKKAKK